MRARGRPGGWRASSRLTTRSLEGLYPPPPRRRRRVARPPPRPPGGGAGPGGRPGAGTPSEFNTVAVSDGIRMGTEGMKASMVSREVVADSIELVARGHLFDAVVALCGCDKTIPGTAMALARLDLPALVLYGGSIDPGSYRGRDVTIQDGFEAGGARAPGRMTLQDRKEVEDRAGPGPGACGGQFTANTMATAPAVCGGSPT